MNFIKKNTILIVLVLLSILSIILVLKWQKNLVFVNEKYKVVSKEKIFIGNKSFLLLLLEKVSDKPSDIQEQVFKVYNLTSNQSLSLFEKREHTIEYRLKDIDGDKIPEIVLNLWTGGNCWQCRWIEILKIRNERIEKIKIDYPEESMEKWLKLIELEDLNNDGVEEIIALDSRWEFYQNVCHACSPEVYVIFSLEDGVYKISLKNFPNFYENEIKRLEKILNNGYYSSYSNEEYYFGKLISLLINYIFKGEKEKGLLELKKYAEKYNFQSKNFKEEIEYIKRNLDKWISEVNIG
ncbi:hypothetical protein HRbin35_00190 [bacterium HR35]|nr:hypothetical protein HRbin35_00190 [bacterium HR35]